MDMPKEGISAHQLKDYTRARTHAHSLVLLKDFEVKNSQGKEIRYLC